MTLASKYGRPLWDTTPYSREVLVQRWRIRLTSLLLFTVILTELLGAYASSNNDNNNSNSSSNNNNHSSSSTTNNSEQHTHNHHHHHQHSIRNIRSSKNSSISILTSHKSVNDADDYSSATLSPLGLSPAVGYEPVEEAYDLQSVYVNLWIPHNLTVNYTFNSIVRSYQCYTTSTIPPFDPSLSSDPAHPSNIVSCVDLLNATQAERSQCLYRRGEQARQRVCSKDLGSSRARTLKESQLAFCSHHPLETVLNDTNIVENASSEECERILYEVEKADELAKRIYCEFEHSLSRYDCQNGYSQKWNCADCKAAYKNWVCAMVLPFHRNGNSYDPCRHFCHLVEQQCPYFLPDTKIQYAGESTFLCMDPDIDEDLEFPPAPCYLPCHLGHSHSGSSQDLLGRAPCYGLSPNSSASSSSSFPSPHSLSSAPSIGGGVVGGPFARAIHLGWMPWLSTALVLPSVLLGVTARTFLLPPFCLGLT